MQEKLREGLGVGVVIEEIEMGGDIKITSQVMFRGDVGQVQLRRTRRTGKGGTAIQVVLKNAA